MSDFSGPEWEPRIDLRETPDGIVLSASVPGLAPGELQAEIGDWTVWLHGEGRSSGRVFARTIPLPAEVKPGQAERFPDQDCRIFIARAVRSHELEEAVVGKPE